MQTIEKKSCLFAVIFGGSSSAKGPRENTSGLRNCTKRLQQLHTSFSLWFHSLIRHQISRTNLVSTPSTNSIFRKFRIVEFANSFDFVCPTSFICQVYGCDSCSAPSDTSMGLKCFFHIHSSCHIVLLVDISSNVRLDRCYPSVAYGFLCLWLRKVVSLDTYPSSCTNSWKNKQQGRVVIPGTVV